MIPEWIGAQGNLQARAHSAKSCATIQGERISTSSPPEMSANLCKSMWKSKVNTSIFHKHSDAGHELGMLVSISSQVFRSMSAPASRIVKYMVTLRWTHFQTENKQTNSLPRLIHKSIFRRGILISIYHLAELCSILCVTAPTRAVILYKLVVWTKENILRHARQESIYIGTYP